MPDTDPKAHAPMTDERLDLIERRYALGIAEDFTLARIIEECCHEIRRLRAERSDTCPTCKGEADWTGTADDNIPCPTCKGAERGEDTRRLDWLHKKGTIEIERQAHPYWSSADTYAIGDQIDDGEEYGSLREAIDRAMDSK